MNKMLNLFIGILLAAIFCSSASAAVLNVYTDRTSWDTAVFGSVIQEETFDGAETTFDADSTNNMVGHLSIDLIGDPDPTGLTGDGFLEVEVGSGNDDYIRVNAGFSAFGIIGFQNDSASNPGGLDLQEIAVRVDGETFLLSDLLGVTQRDVDGNIEVVENDEAIPFVGFALDGTVNNFEFVHGDTVEPVPGGVEQFYIDSIVTALPNPVPVPSSMAVFGVGLMMLTRGHRRKYKR